MVRITDKRFQQINLPSDVIDTKNGNIYHTLSGNDGYGLCNLLNELHEENDKIKSILLKKVDELNDAYNKSAKAGMPTGGIIGELDSFEEICRIMEWIE